MVRISEAITVQYPMVKHAAEIGWVPVSDGDALKKRGGEPGMLFKSELNAALERLNPWMNDTARRQVIEKLESIPSNIEGNWERLSWLRGDRQWHDEAEERHRHVRIIDFDNPARNTLQVTWEWQYKRPPRKGNRADVMFLINGIPVCVVEHKNPKKGDAINEGVTQLRRYEEETPELMGVPQIFNVTHMLDYWYGVTWNINRRYMARWKEERDEEYKFSVQSFFEPTDFLRTLKNWILFYVEDGETRKSIMRQHQRRAIGRIIERCADANKTRGLIWHTQGSGKTFTILTAARLILERKQEFRNATVILVVDRVELEGQLTGWVDKLIGEMQKQDIAVKRANSKDEIEALLRDGRRGLIISMIHKFEGIEKNLDDRDNVYIFIDEAHRSVANELGTYLMSAVPNSTIIGFTGTPIGKTEQGKGTFKIFGHQDDAGYLDKYSIRESIEDETTIPIRYSMAPSDMTVPEADLDKEFFELADSEGVTDVEELNKVLDSAVNLRTFLTSDDRIENVAEFVADHFKKYVEPLGYKAFFVGVNREACAKYKHALDKLLPHEYSKAIYTQNPSDAVERKIVADLQLTDQQEKEARDLFKKPDQNPKILIVTDKLLTGYDAPPLYCMYLDKPMRDHVLLQAIARVNRPYIDKAGIKKDYGLVIDFVGVLREMKKALRFDSEDISGVIEELEVLLKDFRQRIKQAKKEYLDSATGAGSDAKLHDLVYRRFLDIEARNQFYEDYKSIESLWEILSPSPDLRNHIGTFKQLADLYEVVRNAYATQIGYTADLAHKTRRLVQETAQQEGLEKLTKPVTFDVKTLEELTKSKGSKEGKVFNLVRDLRQRISDEPELEPILQSLQAMAEGVLDDMQGRTIDSMEAIKRLATLAQKVEDILKAFKDSGLSLRAFSIYWHLKDNEDLGKAGISAKDIAEDAEREMLERYPNAKYNEEERRHLRASLYRPWIALKGKGVDIGGIIDTILEILLSGDDDE